MRVKLIINIHDEFLPNAIVHGLEWRISTCGIGERWGERNGKKMCEGFEDHA